MRVFFALLALISSLAVPAAAADPSASFDAANALYEQGRFQDAALAYEQILKSGVASPALYFNLGNARFKAGEPGKAIAAYRKAERLAPRDPDLRASLQFVQKQIGGSGAAGGRLEQWLRRLTLNEWTLLTVVPFWITLLLLAAVQFAPKLRPMLRTPAWTAAATTLIAAACLIAAAREASNPRAVVIARDVRVHNGPIDESPTAFTVQDGAELAVLDRKNDWIQVSSGNRVGWLKRNQVSLLAGS